MYSVVKVQDFITRINNSISTLPTKEAEMRKEYLQNSVMVHVLLSNKVTPKIAG